MKELKLTRVEDVEENICKRWFEGLVGMNADMTLFTDGDKLVSHGVVIGMTITVEGKTKKTVWNIHAPLTTIHRARGLHILTASKNCDYCDNLPTGVAC